jgi:hypothetical protein
MRMRISYKEIEIKILFERIIRFQDLDPIVLLKCKDSEFEG